MNRPPRVSIVIPAYQAASFIGETLDSVRAQTYADYEIVVVDDGSIDNTHEVVGTYLQKHRLRGTCIRQPNKKIAGARNTGMRHSAGEYIALLDHDDFWYPEKLDVVMREFERHPDADLVSHRLRIVREGRPVSCTPRSPTGGNTYWTLLFQGNTLPTSGTAFRKDKALAIGGFRENPEFVTVEDYDFWLRLSPIARFRFVDRVLGDYQLVERGASRRIEYHFEQQQYLLRDHFQRCYPQGPDLLTRLRIRRRYSSVHQAALRRLMFFGDARELQKRQLMDMLREFPLEPQNIAQAMLWLAKTWKDAIFS